MAKPKIMATMPYDKTLATLKFSDESDGGGGGSTVPQDYTAEFESILKLNGEPVDELELEFGEYGIDLTDYIDFEKVEAFLGNDTPVTELTINGLTYYGIPYGRTKMDSGNPYGASITFGNRIDTAEIASLEVTIPASRENCDARLGTVGIIGLTKISIKMTASVRANGRFVSAVISNVFTDFTVKNWDGTTGATINNPIPLWILPYHNNAPINSYDVFEMYIKYARPPLITFLDENDNVIKRIMPANAYDNYTSRSNCSIGFIIPAVDSTGQPTHLYLGMYQGNGGLA